MVKTPSASSLYIDLDMRYIDSKAQVLSGKELSFNNIWESEAALQMASDSINLLRP
jgi:AICAR transformylase/IMP cyclohydrolase PurH